MLLRAIVVFALLVPALAACSESEEPDPRQDAYDQLLGAARENIRRDGAALTCDPEFMDIVIDRLDSTGAQAALVRLAMSDACKEAGELEGAEFSPYYR